VRASDVVRLVLLAAIWGASFVFIRVLVPPLGPVWVAALRLLVAGAVLVAWLAATRRDAALATHWRAYLFLGILNSALPFVLYGVAARELPAATMSILNAATPLFGALLAAMFLGERLTGTKLAGIACGVAGVALVSRGGGFVYSAGAMLAVAACLGATLCYASAGVWLKRAGSQLSPYAIAAWSQLLAGLALLPAGMLLPPPGPFTLAVVASLLALALLCSGVAYLLYYRLMQRVGPTRTLTVTFLMPAFGMFWGALFLGESVTATMIVGAVLIVAGTAVVALAGARGAWPGRAADLERNV
jgi:drug/metabolite transporter (DMT)-like permease